MRRSHHHSRPHRPLIRAIQALLEEPPRGVCAAVTMASPPRPFRACAGREHDRPTRVPRAACPRRTAAFVRPRATPGGHGRPAVQSVTARLPADPFLPRAPSTAGEGGAPTRTRCISAVPASSVTLPPSPVKLAPADISTAPLSSAESPAAQGQAPEAPVPEPPLETVTDPLSGPSVLPTVTEPL